MCAQSSMSQAPTVLEAPACHTVKKNIMHELLQPPWQSEKAFSAYLFSSGLDYQLEMQRTVMTMTFLQIKMRTKDRERGGMEWRRTVLPPWDAVLNLSST